MEPEGLSPCSKHLSLSCARLVQSTPLHFLFKLHFNIIPASFRFLHQSLSAPLLLSYVPHPPPTLHLIITNLITLTSTWWAVQIMKLLTVQFSPVCCHFLPQKWDAVSEMLRVNLVANRPVRMDIKLTHAVARNFAEILWERNTQRSPADGASTSDRKPLPGNYMDRGTRFFCGCVFAVISKDLFTLRFFGTSAPLTSHAPESSALGLPITHCTVMSFSAVALALCQWLWECRHSPMKYGVHFMDFWHPTCFFM